MTNFYIYKLTLQNATDKYYAFVANTCKYASEVVTETL